MKKIIYLAVFFYSMLTGCNNGDKPSSFPDKNSVPPYPTLNYAVVKAYPHDVNMFTEGLEFYQGKLFESSGSGGGNDGGPGPYPSGFGIADLQTGKVDMKVELDKKYFGEGITFFNGKVYELTWQNGVGFVYDATTFKKLREFKIPAKEGWGFTHDSTHLIMSDGSSNIYFLQPDSLTVVRTINVVGNGSPIGNLNELEYIDGALYINQWLTSYIYKVDPSNGNVLGRLDLSTLVNEAKIKNPDAEALNGIAHDATTGKTYVTGKNWPTIYEITLN